MPVLRVDDSTRIAYRDEGKGPALLFLHGFPLAGAMWEPQAALFRDRYRVIVPDLRGHGASDAPEGPYTMERHAADILALLDAVGVPAAIVVGMSMGGYVALALVRAQAARVQALVLADSRATPDGDEARARRRALAARVRAGGSEVLVEAMLPDLLAGGAGSGSPGASQGAAQVQAQVQAMTRANRREGLAAALEGMALRPDSRELLPRIAVPALVVVGELDRITPPSDSEAMARALPLGELRVLPQAGHLSSLEAPEAFNLVLGDFLGRLSHGGSRGGDPGGYAVVS